MRSDSQTLPRSTWILMVLLTLGWGFNWPMMKLAVNEMPVWTFRSLCVTAGAVGMFAIARMSRLALLPSSSEWPRLALTSLFNVTLWNVLTAYALTFLPAGRSVILAYTMPLWVTLLSPFILAERITYRRALGVALGMAGMALLIGSELALLRAAPVGALLVLGAAFSWAVGTVLMKRYPTRLPITSFTAWQLLLGGVPIVFGATLLESGRLQPISAAASLAVAYNMLIAFVLCHWVWFKIVSRASAGVSALGTLMIPVVGVFSSTLILGERPGWPEYVALLLVIAAIATVIIPGTGTLKQARSQR